MTRILQIPASRAPLPGARTYLCDQGASIVLFNVEGKLHAIDDSCPHNGASLSGGKLDGLTLQCPAHGLKFDITTGCLHGGGRLRARSYTVTRIDGIINIRPDVITSEEKDK